MICSGVVVLLSSLWLLYMGNKQFKKIRTFTETSPQWTQVANLDEGKKEMLEQKISKFVTNLDQVQQSSILLTPEQLAQAIALYEPLKYLRSTMTPTSIIEDETGRKLLRSQICYELNSTFPWQEKPYLIGALDMTFKIPEESRGLRTEIVAITPTRGEVPQEWIETMNQQDSFLGSLRNEQLSPRGSAALEMIKYVEIVPEGIILATSEEAATEFKKSLSEPLQDEAQEVEALEQ